MITPTLPTIIFITVTFMSYDFSSSPGKFRYLSILSFSAEIF